jgi:1,4-dihydroxy-2-naphthoate octaprenyltransferase
VFRWDAAIAAMIGALAIQVAANFANDASDAKRGADAERVGPPRMVTAGAITPRQMWTATWLTIAVAGLCGVWLITIAGWVVALIGVASIAAMLTYVGGPVPYGYRALGEASVFLFFGLVATVGSRYVHDRSAPADAWWLGVVMGLLAADILVANNLRDIETDERAGKRTLAVVLGRDRTRTLYSTMLLGAFFVIALAAAVGATHPTTAIAALWVGLSIPLVGVARSATDPARLIGLLAGTARLQLAVAVTLALTAALA